MILIEIKYCSAGKQSSVDLLCVIFLGLIKILLRKLLARM